MTTKEELLSTKPPADVISELKSYSTETGKTMEDIKKIFYDTLTQPYLDQFSDINERCRQASKVTLAILSQQYAYKSVAVAFKVFDVTSVRTFTQKVEEVDPVTNLKVKVEKPRHVCDVFGVFQGQNSDAKDYPLKFGILTLWDEACQTQPSFQVGSTYLGEYGASTYEHMYTFSLNENIAPTPTILPNPLPDASSFIPTAFTPYSIAQVKMADQVDGILSAERGDYRLIKGRVRTGRTRLNNKGKLQGFLDILDEQATIQSIKGENAPVQSVMFLNSPEMATRYTTGSILYVLCDITSDEQYGISCFGHMVIPLFGIPGTTAPNQPANPQSGAAVPPVPTAPVQQPPVSEQGNEGGVPQSVPSQSTNQSQAPTPEDISGW